MFRTQVEIGGRAKATPGPLGLAPWLAFPLVTQGDIATWTFLGILGLLAAGAVGWMFRFFLLSRRLGGRIAPRIPQFHSSPYEQVLAELQGISLSLMSNDGRGDFFKLARLVRVFIRRAGLDGAEDMNPEELRRALSEAQFSAKHTRMLLSILERCEAAMHPPDGRPSTIDPNDLIKDFRYIVHQFEGREVPIP